MKPIRIQRKRTRGFKTPFGTVYVGRPSRWGNPFKVSDDLTAEQALLRYRECLLNNIMVFHYFTDYDTANSEFDRFKWMSENIFQLKGKNLSCFCGLDDPCHGDVLLHFANPSMLSVYDPIKLGRSKCWYCGDILTDENRTADHFWPKSKGGRLKVACCKRCNHLKKNYISPRFIVILQRRLNTPRPEHTKKMLKRMIRATESLWERVKGSV